MALPYRMITSTIYGTLNVPAKPPVASSRSLQWTPDGQLLVLGETIIYILTPETGLKFDREGPASKSTANPNIQWSTTAISLPATELYWPEISQEWPALCIGSMDFNWQAVTYSPTNYSSVGSCMLATLSSNLEVLLWAPKTHAYRGEWIRIQDVTEGLRAYLKDSDDVTGTELATGSSIHSLSWSSQPPAARGKNASLLALGSTSGAIYFLGMGNGSLQVRASFQVSDNWITELRWTHWEETEDSAAALLACEVSKRKIILLRVKLVWNLSIDPAIAVSYLNVAPFEDDRRSVTALEWIQPEGRQPILVHCKPGWVHLWREQGPCDWEGTKSITLRPQSTSTASTQLCQASGISYLPQHDALVVALIDGSYHVIHNVATSPSLQDEKNISPCNSTVMSRFARLAFLVAEDKEKAIPKDGSEPERLYLNHVARTWGALAVDSAGVFLWIHQRIFDKSFDFTPDAKIRCMIITAPLVAPNDYDSYAMQEIVTCLSKPRNFFLETPVSILRGVYVHLRRRGFVARNKQKLLEILETEDSIQVSSFATLEPMDDIVTAEWRVGLCEDLSKGLFSNEGLCKTRLKLNMAMACSNALPTEEAFKKSSLALQHHIYIACVRTVFEMLRLVPPTISQNSSMKFVSLMLKKAQMVSLETEESVREVQAISQVDPGPVDSCPACGTDIEFDDILLARCESGHYWSRCSATSCILLTPNVRSCICCGRKMMAIPDSTQRTNMTPNWICEVVLEATEACTNCGNKCVKTV